MDYPEIAYDEIKHSIPDGLAERVLAELQKHVGKDNRISRLALVESTCNVHLERSALANSTYDRQVRLVLDELQGRYPILSSSGAGGYYYASSADEIAAYAAELNSRAMKLLNKSKRLVRQAKRFQRDVQMGLGI
jgi:hypothetical protein